MYSVSNEDCLLALSRVPSASINAVVTDPPYGMRFQSNWSKSGPRHNKIAQDDVFDARWVAEAFRVLKPDGGALVSFCDWGTSHLWRAAIEDAGFSIKSQVIWDREHHGMGDLKGAFAPMHDVIWYAAKGRRIFANGRPKSVIRCRRPSPSEDNGHPTCKPVQLMEDLIRAVSDGKYGTVYDPFMGSGSTGVACAKLGVPFVGTEIDLGYFNTAKDRIAEAYQAADWAELL